MFKKKKKTKMSLTLSDLMRSRYGKPRPPSTELLTSIYKHYKARLFYRALPLLLWSIYLLPFSLVHKIIRRNGPHGREKK